MNIKMRVICSSAKKGMGEFTEMIRDHYDLPGNAASDKFPPEYPCDKERIVIFALSAKGALKDDVRRFCTGLSKDRASNVAVLVDGPQKTADTLAEIITSTGTNYLGSKVISLGGFGPFGGSLNDSLRSELTAWVEEMVAKCK